MKRPPVGTEWHYSFSRVGWDVLMEEKRRERLEGVLWDYID